MRETILEIFCGTGGVGKTTLATSRAVSLAQTKNVLLITIDPSQRLKQILNMNEAEAGELTEINLKELGESESRLTAMLLSPKHTFKKIAGLNNVEINFDNIVLQVLTRPYGGMNEILALVEVQQQLKSEKFDVIVLDTPPGGHFIDFLNANTKIKKFFDSNFMEIFQYLENQLRGQQKKTALFTRIISTGINKLLEYLEKVTGKEFVSVFIDAVANVYKNKDGFLEALKLGDKLQNSSNCRWFLVTSVEQLKLLEASWMVGESAKKLQGEQTLLINRTISKLLPEELNPLPPEIKKLTSSLRSKEEALLNHARQNFSSMKSFPEILAVDPQEHIKKLQQYWNENESIN